MTVLNENVGQGGQGDVVEWGVQWVGYCTYAVPTDVLSSAGFSAEEWHEHNMHAIVSRPTCQWWIEN